MRTGIVRSGKRDELISQGGTPTPSSVRTRQNISIGLTENADTLAVLVALGVDVGQIRSRFPRVLRYPPDRILAKIAAFKEIKVDPFNVLHRDLRLWGADLNHWDARLEVLRELGLDVAKAVMKSPCLLHRPRDVLRAKVEALRQMGLCAAKVVHHFPAVLNLSDDRIHRTLTFLNAHGLNSVRIVNAFPCVLGYCVHTKLLPIVEFVTIEMGCDIDELNRNPASLGFSLDGRLRPRHAFAELHSHRRPSLCALFMYPDRRFARAVGRPIDEYQTWLARYLKR